MSTERNLWSNRLKTDFRAALVVVAVLAAVPLVATSPYTLGILVVSMHFAMIALGWNLLAGFTGQFSLAPAAFAMLGAYTTALLAYHLKAPLALGIPAAILATALLGFLLGRIVLRLKGPYLALTTLGLHLNHWKAPLRTSMPLFRRSITIEIASGNLQYAGFAFLWVVMTTFSMGTELPRVLDEIDSVLEENAEEFVRGYVQKGGQ